MRRRFAAAIAALALASGACGDGGDDSSGLGRDEGTTTSESSDSTAATSSTSTSATTSSPSTGGASPAAPPAPAPSPPAGGQVTSARLELVGRFDQPLHVAFAPGDPTAYVVEKDGRVRAVRAGASSHPVVLDLSGDVSTGGEQGLLGLAFAPRGGYAYVNFTNRAGDTRIVEFPFRDGRFDAGGRREVLAVDQPYSNHNGGNLLFGPDGFLYIGLGDGGSGGDPQNNGQRLDTLLGKLLRIDPRPEAAAAYSVPRDNPFTGRSGARPEIWAYGLRNPWRFTFDRGTGDLWSGDVGQGEWEEVNWAPASSRGGENYGWNRREGSHAYRGGDRPAGNVDPVHDYDHSGGECAVTGGYVYRGAALDFLEGAYVFGDYCEGTLRTLRRDGSAWRAGRLPLRVDALAGFGEDHAGELYAVSLEGPVYRVVPA